jgi:hypothetical protein
MLAMPHLKAVSIDASFARRHQRGKGLAACVLCAIALNSAGAPVRAAAPKSAPDPQSLSVELAAELQLVYHDNVPEFTLRSEQLRQATAAWNASAMNAADHSQMAGWLHEAIRASMPGSTKPLPPSPSFAPVESQAISPSVPQSALVAKHTAQQSPIADPRATRSPIRHSVTPPATGQLPPSEPSSAIGKMESRQDHPAASEASPDPSEGDPFQDDASPDQTNSGSDQATPLSPPPANNHHSTDGPVRIRLQELTPRIQGFEMALRGIDAKLIAGKLSADELAELSAKLNELANQRQFLALYVDALTPVERQKIPALRPLEPTTRLLAEGVANEQAALEHARTDQANSKQAQERATLDRLASELKQSLPLQASPK